MTSTARLGVCQAGVYAAEAETIAAGGRRWRSTREAQEYVDGLLRSDWLAERWPELAEVTVQRRGSGARWSVAVPEETSAASGACRSGRLLIAGPLVQPVLLHELAHLLVHPDDTHGTEFARTHLALVRREMGFPAFAEYREALRRVPALTGL